MINYIYNKNLNYTECKIYLFYEVVRVIFGVPWSTITQTILAIGAVAAAIISIYKLTQPFTKFGRKRLEKAKAKKEAEMKAFGRAIGQEMLKPVYERFDAMEEKIEHVSQLNAEQSEQLDVMEQKIDRNEIDRIRWEILSFSNQCKHGLTPGQDDFNHIFDLHVKYETLLDNYGLKNGQIDIEFKYIKSYYLKLSEEGKI